MGITQPPTAQAGDIYVDAGLGVSTLWAAGSAFGNATMTATQNLTFGGALALIYNISADADPLQFQVGVTGRYSNGFDPTALTFNTLLTPYLTLRIDFQNRFYIGFGASTLTFRRSNGAFGFDGLQLTSVPIAAMGQFGIEWWVAPFFALNLEGTLETMSITGATTLSPLPAISGLISMRFPLGLFGNGGGGSGRGGSRGRSRTKFDGWRYPFGIGR